MLLSRVMHSARHCNNWNQRLSSDLTSRDQRVLVPSERNLMTKSILAGNITGNHGRELNMDLAMEVVPGPCHTNPRPSLMDLYLFPLTRSVQRILTSSSNVRLLIMSHFPPPRRTRQRIVVIT